MPSHALWALPRHISFVYWVDYLSTKKLRHPHFISKHICFVNKETGTARGGRDGLSVLPLGVSWISINIWQKIPARGHELLSKLADDETFTLFVLTDGVALRKEAEKANPGPVTSQNWQTQFCHLLSLCSLLQWTPWVQMAVGHFYLESPILSLINIVLS